MQLFFSHVPIRKRLAEIIQFQLHIYICVYTHVWHSQNWNFCEDYSEQLFLHRELKPLTLTSYTTPASSILLLIQHMPCITSAGPASLWLVFDTFSRTLRSRRRGPSECWTPQKIGGKEKCVRLLSIQVVLKCRLSKSVCTSARKMKCVPPSSVPQEDENAPPQPQPNP